MRCGLEICPVWEPICVWSFMPSQWDRCRIHPWNTLSLLRAWKRCSASLDWLKEDILIYVLFEAYSHDFNVLQALQSDIYSRAGFPLLCLSSAEIFEYEITLPKPFKSKIKILETSPNEVHQFHGNQVYCTEQLRHVHIVCIDNNRHGIRILCRPAAFVAAIRATSFKFQAQPSRIIKFSSHPLSPTLPNPNMNLARDFICLWYTIWLTCRCKNVYCNLLKCSESAWLWCTSENIAMWIVLVKVHRRNLLKSFLN